MKKMGYLLLASSCLFTTTHLSAWWLWSKAEQTKPVQLNGEDAPCTMKALQAKVSEAIDKAQDIPNFSAEEFLALKPKITQLWNHLVKRQSVEVTGIDEEVRPQFQALQNIILHVIVTEMKKQIIGLKGYHFAPLLPLSFCIATEPSTELDNLMQPFSIHSEAQILRDILQKDGQLHACYPKSDLTKRTEEQLAVYIQELSKNRKNLIDSQLATDSIPTTLIGSTYFFTDHCNRQFSVFSSNIPELVDKTALANFGLWFGHLTEKKILKRATIVRDYLEKYDVIPKKR
jgi:hypothetical protein